MAKSTYTAEQNAKYLAARYARQRAAFLHYLGGERCAICGATSKDLHIDHMDRWSKSFTVAKLWAVAELPRVYEELEKCQVLCSDCHATKTGGENRGVERGFTHGTFYGWMKKGCACDDCARHKNEWYDRRNAKRRSGKRAPYKTRRAA